MHSHPLPRVLPRLVVAAALIAAGVLAGSGAGATTYEQGISGTVTAAGVGPIGATVSVEPLDPSVKLPGGGSTTGDYTPGDCMEPCRTFSTEADGHFSIGLAPGEYWVRFNSGWNDLAPEWWGDSPVRAGSKVTVTAGTFATQNPVLEHGGRIRGTVAQTVGDHDTIVQAWVADPSFPGGSFVMNVALTDAAGHYEIPALPTASYFLRFIARTPKLEGWWNGASTIATATPVAVTAPAAVENIDPTLQPYGSISGKVTRNDTGAPVPGVQVELFLIPAPGHFSQPGAYAVTAEDGTYTLPFRSGTYRVRFIGPSGLRAEFWNDAATRETAADTSITLHQTTPNIDVSLEPTALTNLVRPTVFGTRRVGSTLTVKNGSWYPAGPGFAYQWFRSGKPVAGANGKTYRLGAADAGKVLSARVTATAADHASTAAYTQDTGTILPGVLRLTGSAQLRGTPKVGSYLLAVAPHSSPAASVKVRWYRDGKLIPFATSTRYRLATADRGHLVSVRLTLSRAGYTGVVRTVRTTVRVP